jgi:hypothetical protein
MRLWGITASIATAWSYVPRKSLAGSQKPGPHATQPSKIIEHSLIPTALKGQKHP